MEKKTYTVDGLTKAGPYSHVVEAGGFLFVSGMLPVDPLKDIQIHDDIVRATELVLSNISRALAAAGSSLSQVVKMTVFLADMAYFTDMNAVYQRFFPEHPPARSCVAVRAIPGGFPLEMEAVAIKK
ncbi:MAG: RidA family protein [Syntrophaceae bacterium]